MKLVINLAEDAELRKAVLEMVRGAVKTEVRDIIRDEVKKCAGENIRASVIKECKDDVGTRQLRNELHREIYADVRKELVGELRPTILQEVVSILTQGKK